MGLNVRRLGSAAFSLLLLAAALAIDLRWPPADPQARLARQVLGPDAERVALPEGPLAYRAGGRWLLMVEGPGKVGPIRAALLIERDQIRELILLASREGIDGEALDGPSVPRSLAGQPARAPLRVDGVSGATVSAQLLTDQVNHSLSRWREATR